MNNIYLVGFMGTGKTAVGKALARQKKWSFLDLDDLIELKEKRTIPDIFAQSGEPYFRRIESSCLAEVAKEKKFVVACGGGIVINKYNIEIMKKTGIIISLSASVDTIVERTKGSRQRPLLSVADPKKQIELLLKLRAPYYAQADTIIDTSRKSVEAVTDEIVKITEKMAKQKHLLRGKSPAKPKRKIT